MPVTANQKRKAMAVWTLDKIDFKTINIARDKEGFLTVIKYLIHKKT